MRAVAEAEQDARGDARVGERAGARIASGAIPMPPPTRIAPARLGRELGRGARTGRPSGPVSPAPSPRLERRRAARCPGRPPRAGSRAAPRRRSRSAVGDREGPRQVGPALVPAPARVGGEHVELARGGLRALRVERREDPVAARWPRSATTSQSRRPNGAERPLRRGSGLALRPPAAMAGASSAAVQLLQRDGTAAPSRALATIARAAAEAPVIVVMQGMPVADRGACGSRSRRSARRCRSAC